MDKKFRKLVMKNTDEELRILLDFVRKISAKGPETEFLKKEASRRKLNVD